MYIKDGFIKDKTIHKISDMNDRIYNVTYNDGITMIQEPDLYVSSNPYCYGSYLILDEKSEEEIGESYEEISRRI